MPEQSLSTPVRDFVCEHIHSIEQLEVLLLLHARASETWTPARVAEALRIDEALAESALAHLQAQGIAQGSGAQVRAFRYAPSATLAAQAEQTAAAYPGARVEILMLIARCSMERIRTAQVRAFAQAFLLKPPKR